jgi:hypothetical protein
MGASLYTPQQCYSATAHLLGKLQQLQLRSIVAALLHVPLLLLLQLLLPAQQPVASAMPGRAYWLQQLEHQLLQVLLLLLVVGELLLLQQLPLSQPAVVKQDKGETHTAAMSQKTSATLTDAAWRGSWSQSDDRTTNLTRASTTACPGTAHAVLLTRAAHA